METINKIKTFLAIVWRKWEDKRISIKTAWEVTKIIYEKD